MILDTLGIAPASTADDFADRSHAKVRALDAADGPALDQPLRR